MVIATYNRHDDLKECLQSIFSLEVKPYEVIVVDSNSADDTKKLRESFPIKFSSISERNRQRARNLGISMASGEILAFLDDDVLVSKGWLNQIVKPYVTKSVGGVGGRVIPCGASDKFYVKTSKGDTGKVFSSGLVLGNFDLPLRSSIEVDSLIGCNMSFRQDALLKVGGFDENYTGTGYRDDTDLCIQIRRCGYKLIYNPDALVWHKFKGKLACGDWSYWYVRNHVYFYFKNLFARSRLEFPKFLYYMFMPPRDYVLKSGVKIKVEAKLVLNALKGLFDGYHTWQESVKAEMID